MKLLPAAAMAATTLANFDGVCAFRAFSRASSAPGRTKAPQAVRSALPKASFRWAAPTSRHRRFVMSPVSCASQASDVAATADSAEAKGRGGGHGGHGGVQRSKIDKESFVQWDMRRAAMKLHTRNQAPKEGEQENKGPVLNEWKPTRRGYLQFLVDSKIVYEALEETCAADPRLSDFRDTGLERTEALARDVAWLVETYPDATTASGGKAPSPTEISLEYASLLRSTLQSSLPAFMCHFFNLYFAHTAGGRMIGRKVANSCFDGRTLEFYQWRGEVKEILDDVRVKIDAMAKEWTPEEKEQCVAETGRTFHYGGKLMSSITS